MRYRLVMFDFDGTLADSFTVFIKHINIIADEVGFKRIERSELESLKGYSPQQIMKYLGVPMWRLPMIATRMRSRMAREIDQIKLFQGVDAMLQRLSAMGVKQAIVTSNSEANVRAVLGADNAACIDYYECGASLFGKASKLRKVLKQSGIAAPEAICIGDEVRDIDAANSEQIPFAGVAWGYTSAESLRRYAPIEVYTTIEEIISKITTETQR